jgi:hypothetical protein
MSGYIHEMLFVYYTQQRNLSMRRKWQNHYNTLSTSSKTLFIEGGSPFGSLI